MGASLLAGVSGLRSHQRMLDVVANNLANINTPGFKTANVDFADLFSQTLDTGAASSENIGGRNPVQLGMGVKTAGVNTNFEQGSLSATGRTLDVAIEGEGFFVLSDDRQSYFTRVGTFDVDAGNKLVHLGTGYRVLDVEGAQITIPKNVTLPGQTTQTVEVVGNLNANANGPLAEVMTTNVPLTTDRATIASASTEPYALIDGDILTIEVNAGAAQTFTFNAADFADIGAATAQEVADVINATAEHCTASVRDGGLVIKSDSTTSASSLRVTNISGTPADTLGLTTALTTLTGTGLTDLRDLASNIQDYIAGDTIVIVGTDFDGTQIEGTFTFGTGNDGTTVADLISKIDETFTGCTASLDSSGNIVLTADNVGDAGLFISLADGDGSTGATTFSNHSFNRTPGGLGDTKTTSIAIYDSMGGSHVITLTFRKEGTNEWSATASVPASDGVMLDSRIEGIRFGEDGSFSQVVGTGEGDLGLEVSFNGIASPQTVHLDMGTSAGFDGLTQYGADFSAAAVGQDGFGPGSLRSISITADGTIQGNFSNGKISEVAQLQVATFSNPAGLLKQGNNLYLPGSNSGPAVAGTAMTASAGRVSASTIETSNVDIALEFTRLITAQRGFQVNARTITTTDQLMQELANLIR